MGIFGALSTAVTGLSAQSFALENISGNIANSQTVGYKRVETSFEDMIVDGKPAHQTAGSVVASSRATNTVQGDTTASDSDTNMAINGTGFFVVQARTGQVDGKAQFSGGDLYTRRGDFEMDNQGYLVNGAGYYLEGVSIDPATGNPSSSVPGVIQVSNALLPARASTKIDYQLNLPQDPSVAAAAKSGSNLLNSGDFLPPVGFSAAKLTGNIDLRNDTKAKVTGGTDISGSLAAVPFASGNSFSVTVGGVTKTFQFYNSASAPPDSSPTNASTGVVGVDLNGSSGTGANLVSAINGAFPGVASLDASGHLVVQAANLTDQVSVADGASGALAASGMSFATANATTATTGVDFSGSLASMTGMASGESFSLSIGGVTKTFKFYDSVASDPDPTNVSTGVIGVNLNGTTSTGSTLVGAINTAFPGVASIDSSNNLVLTAGSPTTTIAVTPGATSALTALGLSAGTADPTATSTASVNLTNPLSSNFSAGEKFFVTIGGVKKTVQFYDSTAVPAQPNPTSGSTGVIGVDLNGSANTGTALVTAINAAFPGSASLSGGQLVLKGSTVSVADSASGGLAIGGLTATTSAPTNSAISSMLTAGNTLNVKVGTGPTVAVNLSSVTDSASLLTAVNTALTAAGGGAVASYDSSGHLKITAGNNTDTITVGGTGEGAMLGAAAASADPTPVPGSGPVYTISGAQNQAFIDESIEGGSVTAYSANGSPTNVQFRWAKLDSAALGSGHTDTWGLYYLSDSSATGANPMWTRLPSTFTFGSDGALAAGTPTSININSPIINGVQLDNVALNFGDKGLTEGFTDTSGTASVSTLQQDGYPAGKFTSVAIDDSGRVVASYSNGETIDVAQVVTADFSGADALQRMSGGTFAATKESGTPIVSTSPSVTASSLEASNTDISSEFSNLIVTQQAYAAGTKIVTAANDMMQQALNMIR